MEPSSLGAGGKNGLCMLLHFPPSLLYGVWLLCSLAPLCGSFVAVQAPAFTAASVEGLLECSPQQHRCNIASLYTTVNTSD